MSSDDQQKQITMLLERAGSDPAAARQMLAAVYDELRAMARDRLRQERAGHTLQATALVHEAYLRLVGSANLNWESRAHFFGACANSMRQILVEHARRRNSIKRGGDRAREELESVDKADSEDLDLVISIDDVLDKLRAEDPRSAQVVELRFFGGLEMAEIAEVLNSSERTIHREWAFAKARMQQLLASEKPEQA